MSLEDLDLRELCTKAKEAGACDDVDTILEEYSSVKDLVDRNPKNAAEWAYWYARHVVKDRWLEAEPVITKDPHRAYYYAHDVIKGRWPEAEPVIMKDPEWADLYNQNVLQKG